MMGDGKQVVRRFYEELWNGGNLAAADELVAEDYIRHDLRPGDAPRTCRAEGSGAEVQSGVP
jgi:predicted SnoaL-like aldol condensation-catalyzing enzyme